MAERNSSIPNSLRTILANNLRPLNNMEQSSREYLKALKKIAIKTELDKNEYYDDLSLLLYVEQYHYEDDLQRFNMEKSFAKNIEENFFHILVKGITEENTVVTSYDTVKLTNIETEDFFYLNIKKQMNEYIHVTASNCFCKAHNERNLYKVEFILNDYPFRCSHKALLLAKRYELTNYLFPWTQSGNTVRNSSKKARALRKNDHLLTVKWFNKNIERNPEQKQAVLHILNKLPLLGPYILYGPPGTGKTATIIEAVCQAQRYPSTEKILICTSSNTTADFITKRLMEYFTKPKAIMMRIYCLSFPLSDIEKELLDCCNYKSGELYQPREFDLPKIVITTLYTSMRLLYLELKPSTFSYVFIDEAGQVTEPEALMPLILLSNQNDAYRGSLHGKVILTGDPLQLGPVIKSPFAEPILGKSLMERLMKHPPYSENKRSYITKLVRNYRSHPDIFYISNKLFYEEKLKAAYETNFYNNNKWEYRKNFPVIFQNIRGDEKKTANINSPYNLEELSETLNYARCLCGSKIGDSVVQPKDIGIITPFTTQKTMLRKKLVEANLSEIEVGTVQLFQGKEKKVIILSTVRNRSFGSDGKFLGFLSDPRRFNVAVSRAKSLFIIIGNSEVLKKDPNWKFLIDYCHEYNSYFSKKLVVHPVAKGEMTKINYNQNNHTSRHRKGANTFRNRKNGIEHSSKKETNVKLTYAQCAKYTFKKR